MNTAFQELMEIRRSSGQSGNHGDIRITGQDPVYSTPFRLAETGAGVLGAVGVAVSDIHEMQGGAQQTVWVDARHAAAALNSYTWLQKRDAEGHWRVMGNSAAAEAAYKIIQPFATRDGRWFLPHFGISHLKERVLAVLKCEATPDAVAAAVAGRDAQELEDAIAEAQACGGMVRTPEEWRQHPQGATLASRPVVEIEKITDSDPKPAPSGARLLSGTRVLDLTRILAGPVAARTLAEHGADVLMVAAPGAPQIRNFVIDLSHGKRSCFLDLNSAEDAAQLKALVRDADVFFQGYRPGVLAARGFGPQELAELRPGLIYTTINCYGRHGPFQDRAGWEQVAQSVTGICHDNSIDNPDARPELLPVPACDYTTGYLGAYGTLLALAKRAREGGSYHVTVSLCQSAMFLDRQGRVPVTSSDLDLAPNEGAALQMESQTSYGHLRHLAPMIRYSGLHPAWSSPSPALGGDQPVWHY